MAHTPTIEQKPPETLGGLGGRVSIEPANREDRALLLRAIRQRWPIPEATRAELMAAIVKAMTEAAEAGNARDVAGCARVIVAADKLNQIDEHLADKNARIDAGKGTECVLLIDDLPGSGQRPGGDRFNGDIQREGWPR